MKTLSLRLTLLLTSSATWRLLFNRLTHALPCSDAPKLILGSALARALQLICLKSGKIIQTKLFNIPRTIQPLKEDFQYSLAISAIISQPLLALNRMSENLI